jgi:flagellar assembly protein FliH
MSSSSSPSGFKPLFEPAEAAFVPMRPLAEQPLAADAFVPLFGAPSIPAPPPRPSEPVVESPPPEPGQDPVEEVPEDPDEGPRVQDVEFLRAREEGFEVGRRAGLDAGRDELQEQREALSATMDTIVGLRRRLLERTVEDIAAATVEIARRLVLRELAVGVGDVEGLVRDILDDLRAEDDIVVYVAPEDDRSMRDGYPGLLAHVGRDASLRVEASSEITPGGVLVETTFGAVEATVERRFDAFAEAVQAWAQDAVDALDA